MSITTDDNLPKDWPFPLTWDGRIFASYHALSEHLAGTLSATSKRVRRVLARHNYDITAAITALRAELRQPSLAFGAQPVLYEGQEFPSRTAFVEHRCRPLRRGSATISTRAIGMLPPRLLGCAKLRRRPARPSRSFTKAESFQPARRLSRTSPANCRPQPGGSPVTFTRAAGIFLLRLPGCAAQPRSSGARRRLLKNLRRRRRPGCGHLRPPYRLSTRASVSPHGRPSPRIWRHP